MYCIKRGPKKNVVITLYLVDLFIYFLFIFYYIIFIYITFFSSAGKRIWRMLVSAHFLCCLAMLSYVILYYGHVIKKGSQILNNEEGR